MAQEEQNHQAERGLIHGHHSTTSPKTMMIEPPGLTRRRRWTWKKVTVVVD